jgi:hypothetical protein
MEAKLVTGPPSEPLSLDAANQERFFQCLSGGSLLRAGVDQENSLDRFGCGKRAGPAGSTLVKATIQPQRDIVVVREVVGIVQRFA